MQKFTAFTVLLTLVVVVVVGEIVANGYVPDSAAGEDLDNMSLDLPEGINLSNTLATSVLGADEVTSDKLQVTSDKLQVTSDKLQVTSDKLEVTDEGLADFEEVAGGVAVPEAVTANAYLREEQIRSAGFLTAYIEEETKPTEMFKSVKIGDLKGVEVSLDVIRDESEMLAKVYVFRPSVTTEVGQVYDVLKERATAGLNAVVNETNEFGDKSFYMNDGTRPTTAFLTVRVGGLIYAFSYPKAYHAQVKNLVQLIEWEF